jgi:predicted amidohydrolase
MRIALAQVDSKLGAVDHNLSRARAAIDQAAESGADLIVFPELCLSGYAIGCTEGDVSLPADDPALADLARAAGARALVVGFPERGLGGRVYNSAAFFDAGALLHVHRKLYLPTYNGFEERKHFSAGSTMRAFDTRFARSALLICNDAWQPALAFVACQDGAELMIVPANSSRSDPLELDVQAYWHDICALYARLYQCYVVFVNRVGEELGSRFWGGSQVVDPRGEVVCQCPEDEEAVRVTGELDLAGVRDRRRRLPLTREARLALVRRELTRLIDEGGDL